ncbi:hypothetical protein [Ornithinibacillus scapharcae]|uniref:hypothetical protein n=1 Tax=Ornithinibacillus scapharcae TaxID=1147159 RepID=UPI000225B68F|nr:hypothetical protein [Ornithinibacillus scapharcae]
MDKQFKELQDQFNQIPTTFTEKDKQAIRNKISNLQSENKRKKMHLYPKLLTGIVLAITILIVVITVNQQPNMFMTVNDESSDKVMEEKATQFSTEEQADSNDMGIANSTADEENKSESQGLNVFNPETVHEDMILPVISYQPTKNGISIKFKGDTLTGRITDSQPFMFIPNADSWNRIPIAEGDVNKEIPVYFADDEYTSKIVDVEKGSATEITITPETIVYEYSPEGSSIYLVMDEYVGISGQVTKSYDETIALSKELMQLYEEYKTTADDQLLKGLSAFDVFKLYHYANYLGDLEVEYALFSKSDSFPHPNMESFVTETKNAQTQSSYTAVQAKDFYEEMLQIKQFDEIQLRSNEVLIRYTTISDSGRDDHGFRLYLHEDLGIYKVAWMPIQ